MIVLENAFEINNDDFLRGLNVKLKDDINVDSLRCNEVATERCLDELYDGSVVADQLESLWRLSEFENDFYIVEYDDYDLSVKIKFKNIKHIEITYWLPLGLFEPTENGLKQAKLRSMIERDLILTGQIVKFIDNQPTNTYNWGYPKTAEYSSIDGFDKLYKIKSEYGGNVMLESLDGDDDSYILDHSWPLAALMIESVKEPNPKAGVKTLDIDINTIKSVREYLNGCDNSYRINVILDLTDLMLQLGDVEPTFNNNARFLIDNDFDSVDMMNVLGLISGYRVIKG